MNLQESLEILIMPKITYPRPCPTCGKNLSRGYFFQHEKRCGTTEHRVHCPLCTLTVGYKHCMQRHVRQQHSNNPMCFPCMICGTELTNATNLKLHMETFHADQKPCYRCGYCNATFKGRAVRQFGPKFVYE